MLRFLQFRGGEFRVSPELKAAFARLLSWVTLAFLECPGQDDERWRGHSKGELLRSDFRLGGRLGAPRLRRI